MNSAACVMRIMPGCATDETPSRGAIKQRAIALGWMLDQIVVVDSDQGLSRPPPRRSGASAIDREGFQTLVTAVGMAALGPKGMLRGAVDWSMLRSDVPSPRCA